MRCFQIVFLIVLVSVTISAGCTPGSEVGAASGDATAFTHVHVVPMDSARILENQTVIVRGGIIIEIGPADEVDVPADARLVDGAGAYLMPGLTDFHVHLRSTDELLSYLAYGVTSVVHMSGAMSGAPDLLQYRRELEAGERIGPHLYVTGPILDGDPPVFRGVSEVVTTPEGARRAVLRQKEEGYDFIKVYNNLTPDVLVAVAREADEQDMAVVGHIPRVAGRSDALQRAFAAGQDMIAHGEEYFFTYFYEGVDSLLDRGLVPYRDESRIAAAVSMTRAAGAAVTPNLSFIATTRKQLDSLSAVWEDPEIRYLHPDVVEMWEEQNPTTRPSLERFNARERAKYAFVKELTKALNDAGVLLLLGTDASAPGVFPGRSAHLELSELTAAGLTPFEAILTGTRNPGAFTAAHAPSSAHGFGVVEVGRRADLLVVGVNPLEDVRHLSNIKGVMVGGRWFTHDEVTSLRENAAAGYR